MRAIFVFFFCACISSAYSAILFNFQPEIPGHEGQCYVGTTFYNKNDVMINESKDCIQKTCTGRSPVPGKVGITIFTCGVVQVGPGYTIVQDLSKPYPDCCPLPAPVNRNIYEGARRITQ